MKKTCIWLFVLVFIICLTGYISAVADPQGSCGSTAYWSLNEDTGELNITGSGTMTSYPWNLNGAYSDSIISVNIEDGITSICSYAFQGCHYLESITIPQSVTSIGSNAFQSCEKIQSITIPNGVKSIYSYTFQGCGDENEVLPLSRTNLIL